MIYLIKTKKQTISIFSTTLTEIFIIMLLEIVDNKVYKQQKEMRIEEDYNYNKIED